MSGVKSSSRTPEEETLLRELGVTRLQAGWSIIPTYPDKTPTGKWTPLQKKPLSLPEFQKHLNTKRRNTGELPTSLAVVTGKISGLVVLDFDGEEGVKLAESLGLKPHIKTGSGGYHVYFKHPGSHIQTLNSKAKKSLGASFPGLDIRGDGGYAVFCGRNEKGPYEVLRDLSDLEDLETLPKDVKQALGLIPQEESPSPLPVTSPSLTPSPLPLRKLTEAIGEAGLGLGRNNTGSKLAQQLRDNKVPWEEALEVMRKYQETVTAFLDGHGEKSPYTWEEAHRSLEGWYSKPPREPEGKKKLPTRSRSVFDSMYDLEELLSRPKKGWYLKNLLGPRDLVMFAGQPGAGKTFLALDLCMSLVLGREWARHFPYEGEENLRVAYFAGEGVERLTPRVEAVLSAYGVSAQDLRGRFKVFGGVPNLSNLEDINSVVNIVQGYKEKDLPLPSVVVIDTLARAIPGSDENSARDAGLVINALDYLKEELGCAVVVVHHTGKSGESERGSSSFRGAMDGLFRVVKANGIFSLVAEKVKDAEEFSDLVFSLIPVGESVCLGWGLGHTQANPYVAFLTSKSGEKFKLEDIQAEVDPNKSSQTVRNRLKALVEKGQVQTLSEPGKSQLWWVEPVLEGHIRIDFSRSP